ncbi:glycosyltransferase involved in cell wall biosynthesis [Tamilnaduibacter salinus]|uniref:Glycosyltransferase involved in cell wall biosynthesis n=1 Tax=Tamilnaduibacter salinus TaxID=1484056 RepID=A0A2U1CVK3_9GAMM|nr:glycosyltransferase [Tamilnaduibacter salinus]PVY75792.1 glycosyltransferase involved in cell wall biosynthesis [Tamilnaduibacter salinus]
MIQRRSLKALYYLCLLAVAGLLGYKVYLNFFEPEFEAVHAEQVERLHSALEGKTSFRFAVVGNINNSIGVFERRIVPMLNSTDPAFVVSPGNAVSSGGEDKYRAIHGSLGYLDMPYLLTFGDNEFSNFGSFRFYKHFGPHFWTVQVANSRLIFLDSTGKTPYRWQLRWLGDLLRSDTSKHTFVFLGHPLRKPDADPLFDYEDNDLKPDAFRQALIEQFEAHQVDVVFSANLPLYDSQTVNGVRYITTGGGGGLVMNNDTSFYHYLTVTVTPEDIGLELHKLDIGQQPILKTLESLWFFVHSLFFVGYLNFILILCFFIALAIRLHALVFVDRDYYPDFDLDPSPWQQRTLRIAQFTNNYLPFIGGVPLSIDRLHRGLKQAGDKVRIVAPRYRDQPQPEEEPDVIRVPSILAMGENREFRLANIFLRRIRRQIKDVNPDLIHVHHPFWLGSLGLWIAKIMRVPVVYTYHTRLEHYAHFVPLPGRLFRNLISHALIKRFANRCDGVIVPTYSAEEYLRMIGVKSLTFVQPTGIEYDRFRAVSHSAVESLRQELGIGDEHVFVSVSRLSTEKNIDFMIDAIASLREKTDHRFRFLMIGEGHEHARLAERIRDKGIEGCFTLVGAVPPDRMPVYYSLGDSFLFASKSETQGMVILEAMAAGLPVVAVRSSGIDDVVRDGYNGFKTPEKIGPWRDSALRLMSDEPLHQTLSANALSFSKDFSVDHFARDVHGIYAEVLADFHKKKTDSDHDS